MADDDLRTGPEELRIGAVSYLNSRPLIERLEALAPNIRVEVDLPSRLADGLAAGRFDVALIPSIEYFRIPGVRIASDACVACRGAVRSVRLYSRVPIGRIRTLALDEGSRTSAAMARILLVERHGVRPRLQPLPIGASVEDAQADALVVIGDRAMLPTKASYEATWDLGEEWTRWTGLPFVFAMWVARDGVAGGWVDAMLGRARDEGVARIDEISRREAPRLGLSEATCRNYLHDHLVFRLGQRERAGLEHFGRLAERHQLVQEGTGVVRNCPKCSR